MQETGFSKIAPIKSSFIRSLIIFQRDLKTYGCIPVLSIFNESSKAGTSSSMKGSNTAT